MLRYCKNFKGQIAIHPSAWYAGARREKKEKESVQFLT